ncbi:MAG: ABC transporter ATP-binding protein, partial [Clostridia bacterium]|nr:ABC transporter ATP-binding protein [Clostridia bacterium]
LEDISFSLPRGGSLGIIGATGSGKTTLIRLLMRFYDVDKGSVRICGRDVRTVEPAELYPMFGVALQHDFLYADTVEENIKLGRELSAEEVVAVAKTAQAHDFISAFPEGYGHLLAQKAANISGGQKQRLLIARAIAAKPEILVLDDSSSALDYKTDASLRKALRENLAGTTVVTVAQRVSSVKDCGLILVLDEGRIIGKGTHEELLASCAEYREISQSQMGGDFVE